jgi:dipeptidyl aminopeptidase/acylaminoacyl peptidase
MEDHSGMQSLPLPHADPPDGLWPDLIVSGWERVHNHAISPDGTRVAFYRDRNGHSDLWVTRIDRPGFPERLTFNRPFVNWWEDEPPVWSPNGEWLVYGSYVDGVSNLHVVSVQGSAPRALTDLSYDASEPAFSPDGATIAFSTHKGGAAQIATVPFEGGWVFGLTHGAEECSAPAWSSNGQRIIYHASTLEGRRRTDIYTVSADGSAMERLTPADSAEYWYASYSPDGCCVALLSNRSGYDELWLMRTDGSGLRQVSQLRQDIEEYAWSPDGGQIALIASEQGDDHLLVVDVGTGQARHVPTPLGNLSSPQWVAGRDAVVVGFDSPSKPPDLYQCDLQGGQMTPLVSSSAPALRNYPFVAPRYFEYTSLDGWSIPAFLYWPPHPARDGRGYPALIYPHGGPTAEYDLHWDPVRQYFAAKGYAIVCPNFRGSTGYGRQFKEGNLQNWGVGDLNDCLAAADVIGARPGVDRHRVGVWGQSYGGYLSLLAVSKDTAYRFKCGVALYGDSHLKTSWALGDYAGRQDLEWQMGKPALNSAAYEASSPLNYVQNIRAPLLVIHGERDPRVHLNESTQLVDALQRAGKTFEYKTYPDEGHGFANPHNALDALLHIERFLDWHLM